MIFKVVVPLSKPFKDSKGSSEHYIDAISKESALSKVIVRLLQEGKPLIYAEHGKEPRKFGIKDIGLLYHIITKIGDFESKVSEDKVDKKEDKKEDKDDWKQRSVREMKNKKNKGKDDIQTTLLAMDKMAGLLQANGLNNFAEQIDQVSNTIQILVSAPKSGLLSQLIDGLNSDLSREYTSLIQYLQHSSVIEGPGFESFIEELRKHADQEKDHAIKIADRISFLGGVPTLVVNPMSSSSDPVELLKIELRAEDEAIKYYKERIAQADQLQDYGTSHLIKSILIEEEEHRLDLITILGNNL